MQLCQACNYPNKKETQICDYCAEIAGNNNVITKYERLEFGILNFSILKQEYPISIYLKSIRKFLFFSNIGFFVLVPICFIAAIINFTTIFEFCILFLLLWFLDKIFLLPVIEYFAIRIFKNRNKKLELKKDLEALKLDYENLKLVKQQKEKQNLKLAISTAHTSITKLNQQITETNTVIQQVQTSVAISETEKTSILQKLNNTFDFLGFNLNKFLNFYFELKLVERLRHFEFLKWDYQNNSKVSKKLLNENLQIIQTIKNQLSNYKLVEITKKFETLHQLLLKYKHLDERNEIQAKLDKIADFDTSFTNEIDKKVSTNLENDLLYANTHESYLNEFWHDYRQLEEAAEKMDIVNKLKFVE